MVFGEGSLTHLKLSHCEVNILAFGVLALAPIQASELVAEDPSEVTAEHGVA